MGDRLSSQVASGPAPALAAAMPRRLGRYELISELAKGGMGAVYLARSRGVAGFERLVVVKCALPSLTETTQQMLLAEARLAASLQHTNIVQVHDVDTDGPTVFLAMEFLHGQDARHLLRRSWGSGRPLSLESAIAIALAACAGLHYAHEKRDADGSPLEIVHRDISPSNVFVTYDGGVKLIDFGIAKATALPSETQLGSVKGKPGYMSPEQCRCEPLDRRSDVFCVGILLYELTLGKKPFRADNEYLLHKQIIEDDPPPPTSIDAAYPADLEAIVMRALAKDRRDRQPTVLAVQEALTAFATAHRLDVSQFALGRLMSELFADELTEWHRALRAGESLVDHVIKRTTSTLRIVDGGGATGTGDVRAGDARAGDARAGGDDPSVSGVSRVPALTAETMDERPSSARSRRRWLGPLLLGIAGAAVVATVAVQLADRRPAPVPIAPKPESTARPDPAAKLEPVLPAAPTTTEPVLQAAPRPTEPGATPAIPSAPATATETSTTPTKTAPKPTRPRATKRRNHPPPTRSDPARPAPPHVPGPDDIL